MNPADLEYLKKDDIGDVIAKGLAILYEQRPQNPVQYLSRWLMNYEQKLYNDKELNFVQEVQSQKKQQFQVQQQSHQREKELLQQEQQSQEKAQEDTFVSFCQADYLDDIIESSLPNFLKQKYSATQVYLGEEDYLRKSVSDENAEDWSAHLDTKKGKVIRYVGQSDDPFKMLGRHLELGSGVTYRLLQESEENFVFIEEVEKNKEVFFFRFPRLGSYLAVSVFFNDFLNEECYQKGVQERLSYLQSRQEQEVEIERIKKEFEEKVSQLEEGSGEEEIKQLEEERDQQLGEFGEIQEGEIDNANLKRYILCLDTLGQDRAFTEKERQNILSDCARLATEWEKRSKEILLQDVKEQEKYLVELGLENEKATLEMEKQIKEIIRNKVKKILGGEEYSEEQVQNFLENEENEGKTLDAEYEALKEILQNESLNYQRWVLELQKRRILLFPQIVQNILFLLGYQREEINQKDSHVLDWRKVQKEIYGKQLLEKVAEFQTRGPKNGNKLKGYQKLNMVENFLSEDFIKIKEVQKYNLGYATLLRLARIIIQIRKQDILERKVNTEKFNENVDNIVYQNQERENEKEKAKEEFFNNQNENPNEDENQNLTEEQWEAKYLQENPPLEVPEKKIFDVDDDYDFE